MTEPTAPCPCHSQQAYAQCCAPYHAGAVPAEARLLMRSRYSAYALGLAAYLQNTLDATHEDASMGAGEFATMIGSAAKSVAYTSLNILYAADTAGGAHGDAEVLFIAGLRESGRDVGFGELSFFNKKDGRYLYKSGVLVPSSRLPAEQAALTREAFLALALPATGNHKF
jgi:SEC-C motif domain protein